MKTNVASTSIDCYHQIEAEGQLSRQQAQIMAHIAAGRDYTLQELVGLAGLPVNVISARCNKLRELGHLELAAKRPCWVTGRNVSPVKLPTVQLELLT